MSECQLCAFQKVCDDSHLVLWVEAELLAEKLDGLLTSAGVAYQRQEDHFVFASHEGRQHALKVLDQDLTRVEKQSLRVARGNTRVMRAMTSLEQYMQIARTEWFDTALEQDAFTVYLQPIAHAATGAVQAMECLIRLENPFRSGGEIIDAAVARGRVHTFDAYARKLAIRIGSAVHRPGQKLFINFLPSSIYDPEFCMRSTMKALEYTTLQPSDIVFEVVESERIEDQAHLRKICEYYRARGFGFALDDAGAGANSLSMIPELHPDFVKIDKGLVHGMGDPMRRSALEKFVELGRMCGAKLIAEGIENEQMAGQLREMGADWLQGYWIGRPAPAQQYGVIPPPALGQLVQLADALQASEPAKLHLEPAESA